MTPRRPRSRPTGRSGALIAAGVALVAGVLPASAAGIVATVTDESGKPLAEAVVTVTPLDNAPGATAASSGLATATINQQDEMFVPEVVVIHTGGSVIFRNSDTTRHHVYSFASIRQFEFVQNPGDVSPPVRFDQPGIAPIGCNIHDNMIAYIDVTDAPWAGTTDQHGQVTLTGLPAGRFTAKVWHPRLRPRAPPPTRTVTLATDTTTLAVSLPVLPPPRLRGRGSLY
jgi:plastocyanin